jgi:hypothetical protein
VIILAAGSSMAPALAQVEDATRVANVQDASPELLGRAYLWNEYALGLMDMARQGAQVVLFDEGSTHQVDSTNVDDMTAELERRRAMYAGAINGRGFAQVGGEYEARQTTGCAPKTKPILVSLQQRDFEVFTLGERLGVVVERTVVFGGGPELAGYLHGEAGAETIELRSFREGGCGTLWTRYEPPPIKLADPEVWVGTWEGRWDNTWRVRFTISRSEVGYSVLYEHEEQVGGAMESETYPAHPSSKNSIRFGAMEIKLDRKGGDGATVVGRFGPDRTAKLRRLSNPD